MNDESNYTIEDLLNMLTRAMHVVDDSNWYKYFKIWEPVLDDIQNKLITMRQANDLDNCTGQMLDDEARNVGINRNGVNDDFLRFEIKAKIMQRTCEGTMPDLYNLIANSLGCSKNEFKVTPMYEIDGTPNAIQIDDIPLKYEGDLQKTNMLKSVIENSVAFGIRLININYQTFVKSQLYISSTTQIEYEYTVPCKYRDIAYDIDSQTYINEFTQIEHEYTVTNVERIIPTDSQYKILKGNIELNQEFKI